MCYVMRLGGQEIMTRKGNVIMAPSNSSIVELDNYLSILSF